MNYAQRKAAFELVLLSIDSRSVCPFLAMLLGQNNEIIVRNNFFDYDQEKDGFVECEMYWVVNVLTTVSRVEIITNMFGDCVEHIEYNIPWYKSITMLLRSQLITRDDICNNRVWHMLYA